MRIYREDLDNPAPTPPHVINENPDVRHPCESGLKTFPNTGDVTNIALIKTAQDYDRALHYIEQLLDAKPGSKGGDELDVLTTLVEAYEAKHHAICPPDPIEAIKFRMDQLGMTRKDLEALLGRRGRVSEILNKKRGLSLEMIRRLYRTLKPLLRHNTRFEQWKGVRTREIRSLVLRSCSRGCNGGCGRDSLFGMGWRNGK